MPCSWIGRINIVKMVILSKAIYRFDAILIRTFFTQLKQIILKFIWHHKRTAKATLRNRNKAGGLTVQTLDNTSKLEQSEQCSTGGETDTWIKETGQSLEIKPHVDSQLIFDKWARLYNGEKTVSSASRPGACKSMKLGHILTLHTKMNWKGLKVLNMRQ